MRSKVSRGLVPCHGRPSASTERGTKLVLYSPEAPNLFEHYLPTDTYLSVDNKSA